MFDEYLHMGETTRLQVLRQFCRGIRAIFGESCLRKLTATYYQILLDIRRREHSFPGMIGSIDCMHWEWRNCPVTWKEQFTTWFKQKDLTIFLEVVSNYRLSIWQAYFGVAGLTTTSTVCSRHLSSMSSVGGEGSENSFAANGQQYNKGYNLADGIYHRWLVFLKMIRPPIGPKKSWFAQWQEGATKDVERAFGVFQA